MQRFCGGGEEVVFSNGRLFNTQHTMTTHKQMSVSRIFCRSEKGWRAASVKSFKKTKNRPLTPFSACYSPKPIPLHFHHLVIPLLFESSAVSPVSADTVHISQKRGAYEQSKIYGGVFLVGGGGVVLSNDRSFNTWYTKETHRQNSISCTFCLKAKRAAGDTWLNLLQKVVTARQNSRGRDAVKSFKPRSMQPAPARSCSTKPQAYALCAPVNAVRLKSKLSR